jgi:peptidoglycan hydrolase-like protein with peptidoglycan-binding domain
MIRVLPSSGTPSSSAELLRSLEAQLARLMEQLLTLGISVSTTPPPSSTPAPVSTLCQSQVMRQGMTHSCVRIIQERSGVTPQSGFFGPLTERAVRAFQQEHNLTVDGIVGRDTWEKLME